MDKRRETTHFLAQYQHKTESLIIGLMSGTSLDGIDATLVQITDESALLLYHYYLPYSPEMRERISRVCRKESSTVTDVVDVHFALSHWYAKAVNTLLELSGYAPSSIDAISMHGQTVWHSPVPTSFPGPDGPFGVTGTLQLGNPSTLKELTHIPVVSDFRSADMAVGGEGAPLAPYSDYMMFGSSEEGRIIQNIGGIGNATVLPALHGERDIFAFDTGPGNMIIDELVAIYTENKQLYDDKGAIAQRGRVDETIVSHYMNDPYFTKSPPKSTGREVYGKEFTQGFLARCTEHGLSLVDAIATATAFTAESISFAYKTFILPFHPIARVLVCGGGALNLTLLKMLGQRLPEGIEVTTTTAFGIPDQGREAMAFAIIAHQSLRGRSGNLPQVTGARVPVVLGTITL